MDAGFTEQSYRKSVAVAILVASWSASFVRSRRKPSISIPLHSAAMIGKVDQRILKRFDATWSDIKKVKAIVNWRSTVGGVVTSKAVKSADTLMIKIFDAKKVVAHVLAACAAYKSMKKLDEKAQRHDAAKRKVGQLKTKSKKTKIAVMDKEDTFEGGCSSDVD